MTLNIKNEEAHKLAQAIAAATDSSLTKVVLEALTEKWNQVRTKSKGEGRRSLKEELDRISEYCSTLPVLDSRTAEEILGYDDKGVSR